MNKKRSTFFQEIATKAQKLYLLSVFSSTSFFTQHLIIKMIHEIVCGGEENNKQI